MFKAPGKKKIWFGEMMNRIADQQVCWEEEKGK